MTNIKHLFVLIGALVLFSCKKENEPNKILDPLPVVTTQSCLPANATQAWFQLKKDNLSVVVTAINRSSIGFPSANLSGPDGQLRYTFQVAERHYGTATTQIQFRDQNDLPIDPINIFISTSSLKSVVITVNGSFSLYTYSENLVLTLEIAGRIDSPMRLTGTSDFNGSGYSISFSIASPGAKSTVEGLTDGSATATGVGPGSQSTSQTFNFFPDHTLNGNIIWEDFSGGIHCEDDSTGYVVTNQARILLD